MTSTLIAKQDSRIKKIKFSLLMSVYYKSNSIYLEQALKSVWDYQQLKPSQIVLIQDGPVSLEIEQVLLKWKKKLGTILTLFKYDTNKGLALALNKGLTLCKYELVARMDDDDISLPGRFYQQVNYLLCNPNVSVLGTQVEERDQSLKNILSYRKVPLNNDDIKLFSKTRSPINHPSVMYKKSVILSVGGYPKLYPEDWPLWGLLITNKVTFANLNEILVTMRSQDAVSNRRGFKFLIGEIRGLLFLLRCRHLNFIEFTKCLLIRLFVRLAPVKFKRFLYKHFR